MSVPFNDLAALHAGLEADLGSAFAEVVRTSAFIGGAPVERFERAWAAACGRSHAVGLANGTDALTLALRALGIGRGAEVIVPANTFVATAEAVALAGATPVFVDVDPAALLLTPEAVEAAVGPATAAVIAVHLFGHIPDMDAIAAVASRHGLVLLEDAAQAHGATRDGRPAGSWGLAATFSFYPGKNLGALGDGGAMVTDDADLAAAVRSLADHGRGPQGGHPNPLVGTNSRLDGLQAAFLSVKLPHLDAWNAARDRLAARYRVRLAEQGLPLVDAPAQVRSAWHLLVTRVQQRDAVRALMDEAGIATGVHYPTPCHLVPAFAGDRPALPVAERAAGEILSLPMHPLLTEAEVDRACAALARARREAGDESAAGAGRHPATTG